MVYIISGIIYFIIICKNFSNLKNFKYIPVSEELYEDILEVDEYISLQECEIYILDARAAMYMIALNRYNKDYDMFLNGNLGANSIERIKGELNSKENVKLLIFTDLDNLNWQTPIELIEYVLDNYAKTGEVGRFSIYEK